MYNTRLNRLSKKISQSPLCITHIFSQLILNSSSFLLVCDTGFWSCVFDDFFLLGGYLLKSFQNFFALKQYSFRS